MYIASSLVRLTPVKAKTDGQRWWGRGERGNVRIVNKGEDMAN
jgi:hypothetical protein